MRRRWGAGIVALALSAGCERGGSSHDTAATGSASAAPPTLPPLAFKGDEPGALLTWVDDAGDFHVVDKVDLVPEAARGAVRVVLAGRAEGTGESVYVADLRTKGPGGTYPTKAMRRLDWDELGAGKRKARMEALSPSAVPPTAPGPSSEIPAAAVTATIYGASWCGPCHQAQALLKKLGVHVVMKDIEKQDGAQEEMQAKLRRAHRASGSIPIIDVMGQILVGYSEGALRAAVDRAKSGRL